MTDVPAAVGAIRWRLARELIGHLAVEDRWFYPWVIGRGAPETVQLALAMKAEMGDLADMFARYMADWTDQRIASEWPAFRRDTETIQKALRDRIGRENGQLYPLCDPGRTGDQGLGDQGLGVQAPGLAKETNTKASRTMPSRPTKARL